MSLMISWYLYNRNVQFWLIRKSHISEITNFVCVHVHVCVCVCARARAHTLRMGS